MWGVFNDAPLCDRRTTVKVIILVLSFLTTLFSILEVSECSFMETLSSQQGRPFLSQAGLFKYATYDADGHKLGCLSYAGQVDFDGMFRAGRAFSVITALYALGTFLLVSTSVMFCNNHKYSSYYWNAARSLIVCATIAQMFTFFVLGSENCQTHECKLSSVGVLSVFNIFFLAGTSIVLVLEPPPLNPWLVLQSIVPSNSHNDKHDCGSIDSELSTNNSNVFLDMDKGDDDTVDSGVKTSKIAHIMGGSSSSLSDSQQKSTTQSSASISSIQYLISFRLVHFMIALLSWIFAVVGIQHCSFLLVDYKYNDATTLLGLGMFSRAVYRNGEIIGCVAYTDKELFDPSFSSARAFGVLTVLLLTTVLVLFAVLLTVEGLKKKVWCVIRVMLPSAIVTQLLTFVVFHSKVCSREGLDESECTPGSSSILSILNVFVMLSLFVTVCVLPPPPNKIIFINCCGNAYDNEYAENSSSCVGVGSTRSQATMEVFKRQSSKLSRIMESSHEESDEESTDAESSDSADKERLSTMPEEESETICVQVVFGRGEKKTIKEITHPDGSKTITTTVEEWSDTESDNGSVLSEPSNAPHHHEKYDGTAAISRRNFVANPVTSILKLPIATSSRQPEAKKTVSVSPRTYTVELFKPTDAPAKSLTSSIAAQALASSAPFTSDMRRKEQHVFVVDEESLDDDDDKQDGDNSHQSRDPDGIYNQSEDASVNSRPSAGTVANRVKQFQRV